MTNGSGDGCLYATRVMHRRRVPPLYRFVYRVFYLLVDVDRLDALSSRLRLFSVERFNLLSLRTRDHGDGRGLRAWAESLLGSRGIELDGGRIRLLTFPRVLGFAFNPISLWYCEHRDGRLRAVIAEVNNTFGEKHSYLLASDGAPLPYDVPIEKEKVFHVSPFLDRLGQYRFTLGAPDARVRVAIHETREGEAILDATLAGERRALTDAAILGQVLRMPWMTAKVVAGIHWEALKLWLRGARFHRKPEPLRPDVS
ncbi:DUF1365 domain-containing protein [Sinimarinibacterium flocculans]|uniref:DUF1365 domain-containing protein n=1 Tax=Sinimarinibacterium flocculans TaxID=985250 RepID=UPI002491BFDF|nr:DUF1365 domain-containing protein [Sinimarinibacterium flocculans]